MNRKEQKRHRMFGWLITIILAFALLPALVQADMTKITVGRTTGASGFHIPSYVALDKGFYKKEGLDAEFVAMPGATLVKAGIAQNINFVPIPGGGSSASLQGAPIVYIVNESMISQWTITTPPNIKSVEELRGKTFGLGRPGSADYDEAEIVLAKYFGMEPGKDYKVISFRGEPERIAALINGDIQAGILSFPHAARAKVKGFKVLIKTGEYLPRIGGTFWTHRDYLEKNPDTVKAFIRAIANAEQYVRTNEEGTIDIIVKYFGMEDRKVATGVYEEVYNQYGPDIPNDLLNKLFKSRFDRLVTKGNWPKDKPMPDPEQFVARDLLSSTLRGMGYYLQAPRKAQ